MKTAIDKNQELFNALMQATLPVITTKTGKFSLGIVNSRQNGKRFTVSKALAEALELSDTISVMPSAGTHQLVIGKTLSFPNALKFNIRGEGKKTCYAAQFVELMTAMFSLDFGAHVSLTFYDIALDMLDGTPVALVNFPAKPVNQQAVPARETD